MVGKTSKLRSSLYLRPTSSGKFVLLVPAHDDISLGIPYPHYLLSIIFHLAHLLTPMGTFSCRQSLICPKCLEEALFSLVLSIYSHLTVLGLCCCSVVVDGLLTVVASLVVKLGLQGFSDCSTWA